MTIYPKALIARIKGALQAGFKAKQISYWTGIPCQTIYEWKSEDSQASVAPDESVLKDLRVALLGDHDSLAN
jgi:hypothetical protein